MKIKKPLTKHYFRIASFIAVFAIIAIWAFMYSGNNSLTGGVTSLDSSFETLNISSQIVDGSSIEINKELTSLKISGRFNGKGDAKVYAIVDGKKLLVYDFAKKDKKNMATGFVVYGDEIEEKVQEIQDAEEINESDSQEDSQEESYEISFINVSNITNTTIVEENLTVNFTVNNISHLNLTFENLTLENITLKNNSFIGDDLENLTNLTIETNNTYEINASTQINETIEINNSKTTNQEQINIDDAENVEIIENACMETCMLQPVFVSSLVFEIKNSELFLESIYYISSEKGLFLKNEFEDREMNIGSFELINLEDYFSTSAYFDASTSEGYTYVLEGSTLKISAVKEGNWPIKIYAVNDDGIITSNDFFIIIKNSISFGNIPSLEDEFNVDEIANYEIDESLFDPENYELNENLESASYETVPFEIDDKLKNKIKDGSKDDADEKSNDEVRVIIKYKEELTNSHPSIVSYVDELKDSNDLISANVDDEDLINLKKEHFIQKEKLKKINEEVLIIDEAIFVSNEVNGDVAVKEKLSKDKEYRVIQSNKLESDIQKLESQIIDAQRARKISNFNVKVEKTIKSSAIEVASMQPSQIELLFENNEIEGIYLDQAIEPLYIESSSIIQLPQAQNYSITNLGFNLSGAGVNVCLVDSGVNFDVVPYDVGFDLINNDSLPDDDNGHGTMVGYVLHSMVPGADLIVVKALNSSAQAFESDIISALDYCAEQNAHVISLSLGSGAYTGWCDNNILAQKVNELSSQGIIVVAASGNDGSSEFIKSPACASGAVAVGASTKQDEIASFTNYNDAVQIVAPGENVETINIYGEIQSVTGTSISVPFVSGSLALLYQSIDGFENYNFEEKKTRLISTGDVIVEDDRNFSRLNVYNALVSNFSYNFVFENLSVDYNNESNLIVEEQAVGDRCYFGNSGNCTSQYYCQDNHYPGGDGDGFCSSGETCYCVSNINACQHDNVETGSGVSRCINYGSGEQSVRWSCSNSVWTPNGCGYLASACSSSCEITTEANTCASQSTCGTSGGAGNTTSFVDEGYTCLNGAQTTSIYCGTANPSCSGTGSPFKCGLTEDNMYCDSKGRCEYDSGTDTTSYADRGQVCAYIAGSYQFIDANSSHYAANDSQRCSTSTPATGFGDLIVSVYGCDGSGGIYYGSAMADKTIQDCGTGCCYAGTSCVASGSYNVYNWYNFGVGDGVQEDYCIASVVKDCYNDGDCQAGYSCNATNGCEYSACTQNSDCPSNQFCSDDQTCENDFSAGDKCEYYYVYGDNYTESNGACISGYCRDTYEVGSDNDGRCDSGESCFCASSSTSCVTIGPVVYNHGENASSDCMSTGSGTTPGQVAQCSNGVWIGVSCGYSAYNQCDGACLEGRDVMFCSELDNKCYDGGQNVFDYLEGTGVVCSGGSEVAPSAGVNCDATINCVDNACSASRYYRGCSAGTGSCTETNKVAYTAWNSGTGTSISATSYGVGTTCTTNSDQCSTTDHCVGETFYDGYVCNGAGTCNSNTAAIDKDTNTAYCTSAASGCTPRTWYTNTYSSGSNYYCCGDDGSSDSFSVYSASLSGATSSSCSRCNAGTAVGTGTFYGNGYLNDGANICYYGDIVCAYNSGVNGTSEECNDACVGDSDGGTCSTTHTVTSAETCYYTETCTDTTGCGYSNNAALRQYYCDTCSATGVTQGYYCPTAGTSSGGYCYYGTQSCTTTNCNLNNASCSSGTSACNDDGVISAGNCLYNEACSAGAYTAPTSTALPTCTSGAFTDGTNANCYVDGSDQCHYTSSDPCTGTGTSYSTVACYNPGYQTTGATSTCYYDNGGSLDESNSCTTSGCSGISSASINCNEGTVGLTSANCGDWDYSSTTDICYYDSTDPCDADIDGWDWSNSTTFDSQTVISANVDYQYNDAGNKCYYSINCSTTGWVASTDTCYESGSITGSGTSSARCYYSEGCSAAGAAASCESGELITTAITCDTYTNIVDGAGYCYNDAANACYYSASDLCAADSDGWDYTTDTCNEAGTVSTNCFYSEGCTAAGASAGCETGEAPPTTCSAGGWANGAGYCWTGTSCNYSATDLCAADSDGWDYSTASTICAQGATTCCSAGVYYEGVACAASGATTPSFDRDTSQARCQYSSNGCSAFTWLANGTGTGSDCCGDDAGEDFEQTAIAGSACCYNGATLADGATSGSVMCEDGQIYDCGNQATIDGNVDTNNVNCDAVGTKTCDTSTNTWVTTIPTGCSGCTSGSECTSLYCIAGTCRADCSAYTTAQNLCSYNSATAYTTFGICTQNAAGYECDTSVAARSTPSSGSFYYQCSQTSVGYGFSCDTNTLSGGYSAGGVCGGASHSTCYSDYASDASSSITASSIFGTQAAVCAIGYNAYYCDGVADGAFVPGTYRCDGSDTACRSCTTNVDSESLCEAGCGAPAICDEDAVGSYAGSCNGVGQTYLRDICGSGSNCALVDQSVCGSAGTGCTGAASAEGKTPNACDGTSGFVNSTCGYFNDGDTSQTVCDCIKGVAPTYWNLGGDASATTCCDDAGDNRRTRSCTSSCTTDTNDNACCDVSTDCVYNSVCYATTASMTAPWDANLRVSCSAGNWALVENCSAKLSTDTDGGDVPATAGTVTDYTTANGATCNYNNYADVCTSTIALTEYYNSATTYASAAYTCANFEVVASDPDGGNDPTDVGTCTGGTSASCTSNAFVTSAGAGGTDACVGTCGTGANSCVFREWYPYDSTDACSGNDACTSQDYDADTNSNTCNTCRTAGYWNIGGETAATACCGDDSSEFRISEASSTDAPAGYGDATTACCNVATDCNYNDACVATGSASAPALPSKAYCSSGTWLGGDASSTACTGVGGTWLSAGTGTGSDCCGDDTTSDDFEQTEGAGLGCCLDGSVLADATSSGALLCGNGQLYSCNSPATFAFDTDNVTCNSVEGLYCNSSNLWQATIPTGCSGCTVGTDCGSGLCIEGTCATACNSTYDGSRCSDDANAYTAAASGICARNFAGAWSCSKAEVALYTSDYYNDCFYPYNGAPTGVLACDSDVAPSYSANGVCSYSTSTVNTASVNCDVDEVCFDDTNYRSDCSNCYSSGTDWDACDYAVGLGTYSADGICVTGGVCDNSDETCYDGTTLQADCSSCGKATTDNDVCDSIAGSTYSANGMCVEAGADDACDSDGGVCSSTGTTGTLYGSCASASCGYTISNNDACMSGTGTVYSANGMCVTGGTCDTNEVCDNEGTITSDCSGCSSANSDIDRCDSNGGTSFGGDGICITGGTCQTAGVYDNAGTLTASCSNGGGQACLTDAAGTENGAFSTVANGLCVSGSTCDATDIALKSGTYYTNCDGQGGYRCDTSIATGSATFVQDGMCFDDGGAVDGTNFDCLTTGVISLATTTYYGACAANRACDATITSGDFLQDGICYGTTTNCCTSTVVIDSNRDGNVDTCSACSATYDGDPCDDTLTDGAYSQRGVCTGNSCCGTVTVDTNQDGTADTCGCTGANNGSLCDANLDNVFDGVCVGTTCDTTAPAVLQCGTNGCSSADKGANAWTSCVAGSAGMSCDSTFASFTSNFYTQDGTCYGTTCDTTGHMCYDDSAYQASCSSCSFDYDLDNVGDACDINVAAGGDYSAGGLCTYTDTCTAIGSVIRVDASNNNYFVATCDTSGDSCDSSSSTTYAQDGVCASNTCDTDLVALNAGVYYSTCTDTYECDANVNPGYVRDGTCVVANCCSSSEGEVGYGSSKIDTTPVESCSATPTIGLTCDDNPSNGIIIEGITTTADDCCTGTTYFSLGTSATDNSPYDGCGTTCTEGYTCYDIGNIASGLADSEAGICTGASVCSTTVVSKSGTDYIANCGTTGYECDAEVDTSGYACTGICASNTCVANTNLVAKNGAVYSSTCSAGNECDSGVAACGYVRDGYCATTSCCTTLIASGETASALWSDGDESCSCVGNDGELCDASPASGPSVEGTCIAGSCVSGVVVDTNQDGTFETSGCLATYNGAICDSNNDGTADGVCVGTTCDTTAPASLNCGTNGCTSADMGATASTSCATTSGYSCDSGFASFTNYFYTQDGICASGATNNCETSNFVCLQAGTYYAYASRASCAEGALCDDTLTNGDFNAGVYRYDTDDDYCDDCGNLLGEDTNCETACGASAQCDELSPGGWWCAATGVVTAECTSTNSCVYSSAGGKVGLCEFTDSYDTNCGGSASCDAQAPGYDWVSSQTCYSCNNSCTEISDTNVGAIACTTCASGYQADDAGNVCYYGVTCNDAWQSSNEACPDYCVNDNDGGTCAATSHSVSSSETCYYADSCGATGCSLGSSAALRQNYCDTCAAGGVSAGAYCPPDGTLDDAGNLCWYNGAQTCTGTTCNLATESCPDFCINDNNGDTCALTTHTIGSAQTCYWTDTCDASSGCTLTSGTTNNLRSDYCDTCSATGNTNGGYCPTTGTLNGDTCYYGTQACSLTTCSMSTANHPTCTSGDFSASSADCFNSTTATCYSNSGDPCLAGGFSYTTTDLDLNWDYYSITDNGASWRLNDTSNTCYYTTDPCTTSGASFPSSASCLDPGTVSTNCYYDNGGSVNRANDCSATGCTGITGEAPPTTCSAGGWANGAGYCWTGTSCNYSATDLCAADSDGWDYSTASTICAQGATTCCSAGVYYEGVACAASGATTPSFDRDTSQARCQYSTNGCSAYSWNIGGEVNATVCCGDDASENTLSRIASAGMDNSYVTDANDNACCIASTDCVDDSTCVDTTNTARDADGDGDSDYCSAGTWYDCNTDAQCATASGYHCIANDCVNTCSANADCPTGFFCGTGGTCTAKKAQGGTCDFSVTQSDSTTESTGVCSSGYCRDDYDSGNVDGNCDSGDECWCITSSTSCAHNAGVYVTGADGADCYNDGTASEDATKWLCTNGDWGTSNCAAGQFCSAGSCSNCLTTSCATYLSCRDGVNGGCCDSHSECTGVGNDFCQYYSAGDGNASNNPSDDGDVMSGAIEMATQYVCAPAKTFNRGVEASSTDGISLNYSYSRQQSYASDFDWWQFAGDGMITAQTAITTADTDLCFAYNYDPCSLSATTDVVIRNPAGTRTDIGNITQSYAIATGCSTNWIWIDLSPYIGASNGFFQIAMFAGNSDFAREWQFGWNQTETGATDGSNSAWCCDASTDCVDDAPAQGNRISGDPDSTSSGCYNTATYRNTGGGDGVDTEQCRSGTWYAQDADQTACTSAGNSWFVNAPTSGGRCCNDDGASDNSYYYSATPTSATSLSCERCNAGTYSAAATYYGNGYTTGNNLTDTTLTCYYGDIACSAASGANGASGTYCGNGYFSSSNTLCTAASNTTATSGYCYYGDIGCGNGYSSNGAVSSLLYGNGNWIGTTCYYGDIVCSNGNSGNGASGTTQCSSGITTCCNAGVYYEGVSCTNGAVANPSFDRDTSQARCEYSTNGCSAYSWNIGGEVNATVCCGDDASENTLSRIASAGMDNSYVTDANDNACCIASTDCVDDSTCVDTTNTARDADGDGDSDYCSAGTWYDCNTNAQCGTGFYCSANNCVASTLSVTYQNPTPANNARGINNGETINVSVTSVGSNVANCTLEWNGVNESMIMVGSGTSVTCYRAKSSLVDGTTYTYKVYANNSVGTIANESQRAFIENTLPPAPTHSTPTNSARVKANSQAVTWSAGGVDAEGDTITYYWRIDTDATPTTPFTCSSSTTGTTSTACTTIDGTTYYWNIITSDGYENRTATSAFSFRENAKPLISTVTILPASPLTANDLNCSPSGWSDSDSDSAQYYYQWYNGSTLKSTIGPTSTAYNVLSNTQTTKGDIWNCTITPYDGHENGTAITASKTIGNTPPPKVTLTYPSNGNTTFTNRTPTFTWNAVTDADGDAVTYNILVATDAGFSSLVVNQTTSNTYYTQPTELAFSNYYWKVQANDSFNAGTISDTWSFTLVTYVSVQMVVANVTFPSLLPLESDDTTDNNPTPYLIKSYSNTYIDGKQLNVTSGVWTSVPLNTSYWQMKARTSSDGSYNAAASKTTFFNVTNMTDIVKKLNYSATRNNVTIDVAVTVPTYESPGAKYALYSIDWEVAS